MCAWMFTLWLFCEEVLNARLVGIRLLPTAQPGFTDEKQVVRNDPPKVMYLVICLVLGRSLIQSQESTFIK